MMGGVHTKLLRRTRFGMQKLRADTPYYRKEGLSYSTEENQGQEAPVQRETVTIRRAKAPSFSIMSYNTLAESNIVDTDRYKHTPKWALPFEYRLENMIKEIEMYNPDIICLQEVDHDDKFASKLESKGYHSEFHCRGGRYADGCQILYKYKKFSLIDSEKLRFNRIIEEYNVPKKDFKRSNIAQVMVFKVEGFNFPLLIGNTHLYWDPSSEHVKLAQAHYLMHNIDRIKSKHKSDFSIVLCGDFNSIPNSRVYELITKGLPKERAKRKDCLLYSHQSPLVSAYQSRNEPHTNFASVFCGTLDYIFYSKKNLSLNSLLHEVDSSYPPLKKYSAGPNPSMASDHVPIMATFSFELEGN